MTNMVHIIGQHKDSGTTISIYREDKTAQESIRLMQECGYIVTVQAGYSVTTDEGRR